jgi:acyl-coenzyme A synthetase/AMP-(fatty) acid ligase
MIVETVPPWQCAPARHCAPELPKTETGKLLRRVLQAELK